jgi:hypothetical protein
MSILLSMVVSPQRGFKTLKIRFPQIRRLPAAVHYGWGKVALGRIMLTISINLEDIKNRQLELVKYFVARNRVVP